MQKLRSNHLRTKNFAEIATRSILAIEAYYAEIEQVLEISKIQRPNLILNIDEIPNFPKMLNLTEFLSRNQEIDVSENAYHEKLQKVLGAEEDNLRFLNDKICQILDDHKRLVLQNQEKLLSESLQKESALQQANYLQKKFQDIERTNLINLEETKLKYEKSEFESKNNYLIEVKDLRSKISIQSADIANLNSELEQTKSQWKLEVAEIHKLYENKLDDLSNSINHQSSFHKQKIQELELSFHGRETQLLIELDKLQTEDSSVLKNLRENVERLQIKVQDLRDVLKAVCERTNPLFDRFAGKEDIAEDFQRRKDELAEFATNETWEHYSELLTELEFIGYAFSKMSTDND